MSCALVGSPTANGSAAFFAAVLRGGAGLAAAPGARPSSTGATAAGAAGCGAGGAALSNVARNRLATGASMVLDADLTYSPISASLASTILLSTPSSLASSCTRGLPATALLIPRPAGGPRSTSLGHLKAAHYSDFIVCSYQSSYLVVRGRGPLRPHQVRAEPSLPSVVPVAGATGLPRTHAAGRCQGLRPGAAPARRLDAAPPVPDSSGWGGYAHPGPVVGVSDRAPRAGSVHHFG